MEPINFIVIIVASLVSFGIGSFWYSPFLFGKEWMEGRKISEKDLGSMQTSSVLRSYIIQFVLTLITFTVLAFVINMSQAQTSTDGAFIGLLGWLGFVIPLSVSGLLWKKETFTLFLIDAVNHLVVLTIGGAIIGAWR
jgi:heme/copper-type cytochrome/quinol oxidase subunit 4